MRKIVIIITLITLVASIVGSGLAILLVEDTTQVDLGNTTVSAE